jgi:ubiquinone/menaquinone biosynthesis C-methylase UbiE
MLKEKEIFDKIEQSWSENAKPYDDIIQKQLRNKKDISHWTEEFKTYLGKPDSQIVLDVGTGPGFFAILFSKIGYQVYAIDGSEGMVAQAENNFRLEQVDVSLYCGDVVKLEQFEKNYFDAIVSRDVVWTLYNPKEAYKRWMDLLKPGGVLLVYDGNYRMDRHSLRLKLWEKLSHFLIFLTEGKRKTKSKADKEKNMVFKQLPMVTVERPQMDKELLKELGYDVCYIGRDKYRDSIFRWDHWLYGYQGKSFKIIAKKPK